MAAVVTSEVVFVGYTQATRNDKKAETIRSTSALLRNACTLDIVER